MYFFIRVISHFFIFSITIPVMVKFTPHPYGGSIPKLSKLSPPSPRSPLYTSAYSTEQRTQRISSLLTAIQWFLTTAYGLYHPRPVQTTGKKKKKNKQTSKLKWSLKDWNDSLSVAPKVFWDFAVQFSAGAIADIQAETYIISYTLIWQYIKDLNVAMHFRGTMYQTEHCYGIGNTENLHLLESDTMIISPSITS